MVAPVELSKPFCGLVVRSGEPFRRRVVHFHGYPDHLELVTPYILLGRQSGQTVVRGVVGFEVDRYHYRTFL